MTSKQTAAALINYSRITPPASLSGALIRAHEGAMPGGARVLSNETAPKSGPGIGGESPRNKQDGQDGQAPPSSSPTSSSPLSSTAGEQPAQAVKPQHPEGTRGAGPESSTATTTATPVRNISSTNGSSTETRPGASLSNGNLPLLGVAGLPVAPPAPTTGEYLMMSRARRRT